jgi:hypothetical protein
LQDLENKGDSLQDLQNVGVMVSLELGRHKPEAGGFCLPSLIIREVSSGLVEKMGSRKRVVRDERRD